VVGAGLFGSCIINVFFSKAGVKLGDKTDDVDKLEADDNDEDELDESEEDTHCWSSYALLSKLFGTRNSLLSASASTSLSLHHFLQSYSKKSSIGNRSNFIFSPGITSAEVKGVELSEDDDELDDEDDELDKKRAL
jgi:hypothetical protein